MPIDMEKEERAGFSDSSRAPNPRSNSGKSTRRSAGNSTVARGADAGEAQEPRPSSLDVLLSLLQSDLGEIQDYGGAVRFFDHPQGLIIQLPGAQLCKIHAQIHSGETCPHC